MAALKPLFDRTAIDTIKGYFYQFDFSITSVLSLINDHDTILIEGIEDVDIHTASEDVAVQCKYYAKTEYNHSVIAKPIRQMLNHFAEFKKGKEKKIRYHLRGHFESGQEKFKTDFSIEEFKTNFLIYSKFKTTEGAKVKEVFSHHNELGLNDIDLNEFREQLEININATSFEKQVSELMSVIKTQFSCSQFSAENFYYNNALRVIKELAILPHASDRTISKKEFVKKINTSSILFNEWFIKLKGKRLHLANLRKENFTFLNVSPFERLFLIEINETIDLLTDLKDLIFLISKKWSKFSKYEKKPFCPYIYIHNIGRENLINLKRDLKSESFHFVDGFDFDGSSFNVNSIIIETNSHHPIKIKIINSLEYIEPTFTSIAKTREIYQFYYTNPYYDLDIASVKHLKIQVEHLTDIKAII